MDQIKALAAVQELDLKILSLTKERAAFPEAIRIIDEAKAKNLVGLTAKRAAVAELTSKVKEVDASLDLNRDRLKRAEAKLEGVQNSHEYQLANVEIEQLKRACSLGEEQRARLKAEHELIAGEISKLEEMDQKLAQEREARQSMSATQLKKLDADLASIAADRTKLLPLIEPRVLALYDRIRAQRAGMGFVAAIAGLCKGCNRMVPPQMFNELQKPKPPLHQCPSCHRILYVPA